MIIPFVATLLSKETIKTDSPFKSASCIKLYIESKISSLKHYINIFTKYPISHCKVKYFIPICSQFFKRCLEVFIILFILFCNINSKFYLNFDTLAI